MSVFQYQIIAQTDHEVPPERIINALGKVFLAVVQIDMVHDAGVPIDVYRTLKEGGEDV